MQLQEKGKLSFEWRVLDTKDYIQGNTVTNESNSEARKYIGLAFKSFKERYRNHTNDFNHKKYVNNTELAKLFIMGNFKKSLW